MSAILELVAGPIARRKPKSKPPGGIKLPLAALLTASAILLAPVAHAEPGWQCQTWCAPATICHTTCTLHDVDGLHVCRSDQYQYPWGMQQSQTNCT